MKKRSTLFGGKLLLICLLTSLHFTTSAQNVAKLVRVSNGDTVPFLEYKPAGHDAPGNTRTYPLIVFLHGGGERSDNTSLTPGSPVWKLQGLDSSANSGFGPARLIKLGSKMAFTWNGQVDTFIVLSPMCRATVRTGGSAGQPVGQWAHTYITRILEYAKTSLKIDTNRIYLTGLSFGGGGTFAYLAFNAIGPQRLAAAAPICSPEGQFDWFGTTPNGPQYIGEAKLPVWGFHAMDDPDTDATGGTIDPINSINNRVPAPVVKALMTIWPTGGHAIWGRVYNTDIYPYSYDGIINIYEWFLGQNRKHRDSLPNSLPVASVGNDTTILTTSGNAILNGSASTDADGIIVRYVWKKLSGPAGGTIASPLGSASSTTVSGLTTAGVYKYQLNVVDRRGAIARDTLTITVNTPPVNNGNAVSFTSTTSRINAGNVTEVINASAFTLEAQFKYDSVSGTTTIFRKYISNTDRIMLFANSANNSIGFVVANGVNSYGLTDPNTLSRGTWHHVAAVFDGAQAVASNRLKIYIDGVAQTVTVTNTPPTNTSSSTGSFLAGGETWCCQVSVIDEVRVWDTVLSVGTINSWRNKLLGSCHTNFSHLAVYWPLDNSANATAATAALGTSYPGIITNGSYVSSNQASAPSDCIGSPAVLSDYTEEVASAQISGRLYPNPTHGPVQLELNSQASKSVTIHVIDMTGKYVYRQQAPVVKGSNRLSVNLSSLRPGNYLIDVRDGKTTLGKYKVVKR